MHDNAFALEINIIVIFVIYDDIPIVQSFNKLCCELTCVFMYVQIHYQFIILKSCLLHYRSAKIHGGNNRQC